MRERETDKQTEAERDRRTEAERERVSERKRERERGGGGTDRGREREECVDRKKLRMRHKET